MKYSKNRPNSNRWSWRKLSVLLLAFLLVAGFSVYGYALLAEEPTIEEVVANELTFDSSVAIAEKEIIKKDYTLFIRKTKVPYSFGETLNFYKIT
jgi:hypothetical protein